MSEAAYLLSVAAREYIPREGRKLYRAYGNKTVLINKLMPRARTYKGGDGRVRENIDVLPMPGGAHPQVATFNPVDRNFAQPLYQTMRYMEVSVIADKIEMWVLNKGDDGALFNIVGEKLSKSASDAGKYAEVACYLPGALSSSFKENITGLAEVANDGSTSSFDGGTYTTFGDLSRTNGAYYNRAVKGKILDLNSAAMTPRRFSQTLSDATIEDQRPDIGLGTPTFLVYAEDRFQPQQRFNDSKPDIGFEYIVYHGIPLVATRYCPGAYISGTNDTTGEDPIPWEYVKYTSNQPGSTALTAYPTITGETFFWGSTRDEHTHLYLGDHPVMKLGFDDFVPDPRTDKLVGRIRLAWCLFVRDPRRWYQIKRIGSF